MAGEFRHTDSVPAGKLTEAVYEGIGTHIFNSQAKGDILYASSTTQLSRLGIGATNKALIVIGGVPTWQSTLAGLTFTAPVINGTVTTTGLTLPAFTAGNITLGAGKALKTANLLLMEASSAGFHIRDAADTGYRNLLLRDVEFTRYCEAAANAAAIATPSVNDNYLMLQAWDTDNALVEIARLAGAADPYFSMGGSQEFKFYESGVATFGGTISIFDAGGETISGDGTDLTIASGALINLTASSDVVIPVNIGLHLGDGAEKLESNNTDLTINSGGAINLTATSDVVVPANIGVTFGTGEKIEGNNTDLTITSGADIGLTATGDVNIPSGVGVTFGDDGEKIEGDGTDLTISSSGILNMDAGGVESLQLSAAGILTLAKQPGASAYAASTGQKVNTGTASSRHIIFDTEVYDVQNEYDSSVISGTADATAANKLHDADGGFSAGDVGRKVFNSTDVTYAIVTGFVDSGELDLDTDIMASGEAYKLYFSKFTATEAGKYMVSALATLESIDDAKRLITFIKVNGSSVARSYSHGSVTAFLGACVSKVVDLSASDYVQCSVLQDTGGDETIKNNVDYTYMNVQKVA